MPFVLGRDLSTLALRVLAAVRPQAPLRVLALGMEVFIPSKEHSSSLVPYSFSKTSTSLGSGPRLPRHLPVRGRVGKGHAAFEAD